MNRKLIVIVLVLLFSVGLLVAQNGSQSSNSSNKVNISKTDIENFLQALPPEQVSQISGSPDAKKKLVNHLQEIFTLNQEAERLGISSRADIQTELGIREKILLASIYRERELNKNPQAVEVSAKERDEYLAKNPAVWDQFVNANPRLKAQPAEKRDEVKPQFAELMVMVERAKAAGVDKDPGFQMLLRIQTASFLSSQALQDMKTNTKVTDDELKAYYDAHKDQFQETRARHILIMFPEQRQQKEQRQQQQPPGTDATAPAKPAETGKPQTKEEAQKLAQDLLVRVKKGEDFATLAKQYSDDTGSAQQGGDLGYVRKDVQFVPEFKEALFKLKPGEVSDIVQTQFGYHIIKVDEQRIAPFDQEMKEDLKEQVVAQKVQDQVTALKARNLVIVDENFNIPAPTAPAAQPAMPQNQQQQNQQQPAPPVRPGMMAPNNGQQRLY